MMKGLAFLTLCIVSLASAQKGPCFQFDGNAYLEFEPDNFDLSNSAHYMMSFQTVQENGILLYARGSHDYEVLYVKDGKLIYDLFNPEPSGVGRTFGTRLTSSHKVNNNTLITVEIFRNRRDRRGRARMPGDRPPIQTGMVLKVPGAGTPEEIHLMRQNRLVGVQIMLPVYIGGASRELSATVRQFRGQISNIREKKNNKIFEDPSRNIGVTRCLGRRPF